MKKLINLLGSCLIISSSASTLASCSVPTDPIDVYVGGSKLSEEGLKSYKIDSMSDINPFVYVANMVLNLVSFSSEKSSSPAMEKFIGDAKWLGIDYDLFGDSKSHESAGNTYYQFPDDAQNNTKSIFKKAYRSSGNNRFSSINFYDENNNTFNLKREIEPKSIKATEIRQSEDKKTFTNFDTNLDDVYNNITSTDKTTFKSYIETFKGKSLAFANKDNIAENVSFKLDIRDKAEDITDKDNLSNTAVDLKDKPEINIVSLLQTSDDGKTSLTPYTQYCPYFYETTSPFKAELDFSTEKGVTFEIDVDIPSFYIFYNVNIAQSSSGIPDSDSYVAFLTPFGYEFNNDIKQNTDNENAFKSFVDVKDTWRPEIKVKQTNNK